MPRTSQSSAELVWPLALRQAAGCYSATQQGIYRVVVENVFDQDRPLLSDVSLLSLIAGWGIQRAIGQMVRGRELETETSWAVLASCCLRLRQMAVRSKSHFSGTNRTTQRPALINSDQCISINSNLINSNSSGDNYP